jgi:transcription antitermination factor NusG
MQRAEDRILWYALHVRTRFEKIIAQNLRFKGFEEFLPMYRRAVRTPADRVREIELPLFPGYLFCRFNAINRLPILVVPGVKAVVGTRKDLLPVDESELDGIRAVLNSKAFCEPWPYLEIGQRVVVDRGPMAGAEGIVQILKNKYRLVISVSMLQRSVAVEIDRECLKPVKQSGSPRKAEGSGESRDNVLVF